MPKFSLYGDSELGYVQEITGGHDHGGTSPTTSYGEYTLYQGEGAYGFTRGMCYNTVSSLADRTVSQIVNDEGKLYLPEIFDPVLLSDVSHPTSCIILSSVIKHSLGAIVSHPFHVVSARQAAQFIGKEVKYSGFHVEPLAEVYKTNGLYGLISGLVPRLLSLIVLYGVADLITWRCEKYIVKYPPIDYNNQMRTVSEYGVREVYREPEESQPHLQADDDSDPTDGAGNFLNGKNDSNKDDLKSHFVEFSAKDQISEGGMMKLAERWQKIVGRLFSNPLSIVTRKMEVVGSGIRAGEPPLMPAYTSWIDCFKEMYTV
ncbi:hypothetical protein AAG570_004626 [Ranatra chinensis]|uniref:Uncharacterized protein n=1 Tax=Ranatra chinensis TaxID=642074 RepID=A0ABD0Y2U3_9HEMI